MAVLSRTRPASWLELCSRTFKLRAVRATPPIEHRLYHYFQCDAVVLIKLEKD